MKKMVALCLLLISLLITNGCIDSRNGSIIEEASTVASISIKMLPGGDSSLKSTEDKKQISGILNYINTIDLTKTAKDVTQYVGASYIITVCYDDKTTAEYVHFGNMFFRKSGEWYEMPYVQATKIEGVYNSLR